MGQLRKSTAFRNYTLLFATGFAAILVWTALAWAGNDPWKSKPYKQWDDKDIQRILGDSPWVRLAIVDAGWTPATGTQTQNPGGMNPQDGAVAPPSSANSGSRMEGDTVPVQEQARPTARFLVYWMSSKTMRAAVARRQVLHSGKSEADAHQYVTAPQAEYQIVVQGRDMTPFLRFDEKFYQSNSFLQLKKAGEKVSPSHVVYERTPDGRSINAVVFFFLKKLPSGQPLILPQEKSIEFNCKVEGSDLKVNFDPQTMTDQGGEDL